MNKNESKVAEGVLHLQKQVLTSVEASSLLGLSLSRLYKLTSARKIPHYKSPGGKFNYFSREELEAWALSNRVATMDEINDQAQARTRR